MDTMSVPEFAASIGTTPHTVYRRLPSGQRRVDAETASALRSDIGVIPAGWPLSRTDAFVLAALDRHPFGARSARTVARWAGISPTAASNALRSLERKEFVRHETRRVVENQARDVGVWVPAKDSDQWRAIAQLIALVEPPTARPSAPSRHLPSRLWQHFWNHPSPSAIDTRTDGSYVAARLLQSNDAEAVAWAANNLSSSDLASVADIRGADPSLRRLAFNLAGR